MRPLVEERLQHWDTLSPEQQKDLLAREAAIQAFTFIQTGTNVPSLSPPISTNRQQLLDQGVNDLQKMSEDKRQALLAEWKKMFDLSDEEKVKMLRTLSAPEQAQIKKTLDKFDGLTLAQRASCVRSFEKFSHLSLEERQQFLKNAVKWSRMSAEERKQWQDLVERAPLLPPTFLTAPNPPPLPRIRPKAKPQIAETNGG
jgi:hypothetical protein